MYGLNELLLVFGIPMAVYAAWKIINSEWWGTIFAVGLVLNVVGFIYKFLY